MHFCICTLSLLLLWKHARASLLEHEAQTCERDGKTAWLSFSWSWTCEFVLLRPVTGQQNQSASAQTHELKNIFAIYARGILKLFVRQYYTDNRQMIQNVRYFFLYPWFKEETQAQNIFGKNKFCPLVPCLVGFTSVCSPSCHEPPTLGRGHPWWCFCSFLKTRKHTFYLDVNIGAFNILTLMWLSLARK